MDLNTASLAVMAKAVGLEAAYDLLFWRPFLSWEEVANVPSMGPAQIASLKAAGARIRLPDDPRTRREEQERGWP